MSDDGLVSRHLNRRLSRPLARLLARTPVTPNQVSVISFLVGLAALPAYVLGWNLVGGLLAQAFSVLDGADGDLARLKGMATPFGAFLDAVLDRYGDAAIILGMTIWAQTHEPHPFPWLVGFLALVGCLMIPYTRARAEASTSVRFREGFAALFTHDMRLFLIMLGSLVGQIYATLFLLALSTNIIVAYRLLVVRRGYRS